MKSRQELESLLRSKLKLDIDVSSISDDQSIQEIGMDSLVLMRLIYLLEDDYQVTLSTAEILEVATYGDLLQLLDRKLGDSRAGAALGQA